MLKSMVGVEGEYLLLNAQGEAIVPPQYWERDGFPLLGEVRGEPGKTAAETVGNFTQERIKCADRVRSGNSLVFMDIFRVRLKVYKEAMKQVTEAKGDAIGKTKNIYGTNVEDFSDQIISKGKIQGINASCGLHIHFSSRDEDIFKVKRPVYEPVSIPVEMVPLANLPDELQGAQQLMKNFMKPELHLYRKEGYEDEKELKAVASQLNRPTIEWIVKSMDEAFFDRFAPAEKNRTKYRQPGFYELKDHGFEYRSLPANPETIEALPEIVGKAFELLGLLNKFD